MLSISHLSTAVTLTRDKQHQRRKDYFGSQFNRFQSMICFWLCCFGACGEVKHRGRESMQGEAAHLLEAESRKTRQAQASQCPLQGNAHSDITSSNEAPPPKGFSISQQWLSP